MKQKKRQPIDYPDAFRYLFGSFLSPVDLSTEMGQEFHWFKKSKTSEKK